MENNSDYEKTKRSPEERRKPGKIPSLEELRLFNWILEYGARYCPRPRPIPPIDRPKDIPLPKPPKPPKSKKKYKRKRSDIQLKPPV